MSSLIPMRVEEMRHIFQNLQEFLAFHFYCPNSEQPNVHRRRSVHTLCKATSTQLQLQGNLSIIATTCICLQGIILSNGRLKSSQITWCYLKKFIDLFEEESDRKSEERKTKREQERYHLITVKLVKWQQLGLLQVGVKSLEFHLDLVCGSREPNTYAILLSLQDTLAGSWIESGIGETQYDASIASGSLVPCTAVPAPVFYVYDSLLRKKF